MKIIIRVEMLNRKDWVPLEKAYLGVGTRMTEIIDKETPIYEGFGTQSDMWFNILSGNRVSTHYKGHLAKRCFYPRGLPENISSEVYQAWSDNPGQHPNSLTLKQLEGFDWRAASNYGEIYETGGPFMGTMSYLKNLSRDSDSIRIVYWFIKG